jgi:hypothetical protein
MMSSIIILSSIAALSSISCFPSSLLSFAWADDPPIIRPTPNFETYSEAEGKKNKHAPQSMESMIIIEDSNQLPRESSALQSEESYDYQESKSNKIRQQRQKSSNNNMREQKKPDVELHGYHHSSSQSEYDSYMHWCEKVLGIKSVVEIHEFEYVDHLQLYWEQKKNNDRTKKKKEYLDPTNFDWLKQYYNTEEQKVDESSNGNNVNAKNDNNHDDSDAAAALPIRLVRGLAAKYDIQPGDIVLSIPLYSLLSIPTTIDHDPVLSSILGLEARKRYGWADTSEYELQLLVVAVLYHRSLGKDSPLSHYIDILLGTPTDSFPFLWSDAEMDEKLGTGSNGGEVIQNARGIQRHVYEMYDEVIGTLVKAHPELFAPPNDYSRGNSEWTYSYENFQWAFAMVISRHHYLPIHELDDDVSDNTPKRTKHTITTTTNANSLLVENQIMHETLSSVTDVAPPANQPTDLWVDEAHNEERVIVEDETTMVMTDDDDDTTVQPLPIKHSFLAPLADLINFGPPCLKGQYNENERVFEFIATCHFAKGNEVTFWYSSDCSDVIIANFGFMHPLVPTCTEETKEDWKENNKQMREQKDMLETELWQTYEKVDLLKDALTKIEKRLLSCGCEGEEKKKQQTTESMTVTGGEPTHKLRKNGHHQALRQEGRTQQELDQQQILNQQIEEELG